MPEALPVSFLEETGIFETMRSEKRKIIALEEHLDRLFESAHAIKLPLGHSRKSLRTLLEKEIASGPYPDAYVRITFVRDGKSARLFLIVKEAKRYPPSFYKKGISIRTSPTRRNAVSAIDAQLKVKEFLNGLLATVDGLVSEEEAFEEIYLDSRGYVTEGRISNIFLVKDGTLVTPPLFLGVLRGITRDQVIRETKRIGAVIREEPFTRFNLYGADEVFLTNTSMGVMPVSSVDKRIISEGFVGPVAKSLIACLRRQGMTEHA